MFGSQFQIDSKKAIIPVGRAFINKYFVGICVSYRKRSFLFSEAAGRSGGWAGGKESGGKELNSIFNNDLGLSLGCFGFFGGGD